jgi:hypothetical protein
MAVVMGVISICALFLESYLMPSPGGAQTEGASEPELLRSGLRKDGQSLLSETPGENGIQPRNHHNLFTLMALLDNLGASMDFGKQLPVAQRKPNLR